MSPDSQCATFSNTIGLAEVKKVLHAPDSARLHFIEITAQHFLACLSFIH